jgi:hypothetical protein
MLPVLNKISNSSEISVEYVGMFTAAFADSFA